LTGVPSSTGGNVSGHQGRLMFQTVENTRN